MKKPYSIILIAIAVLMVVSSAQASRYPGGEFRAFWADTWHSGILNPDETTATVNFIKSCNCNAIVAQMSKVADSYFTSSYLPRATNVQVGYDALDDVCAKAHAQGMEVHAWVCVYRCWTQMNPAPWPEHVYNAHPGWLSKTNTGAMFAGTESYLDPGNPQAMGWLVDVYMEIVNNYPIDGIHFDRIRYPGTDWGYNALAVSRFNNEYGRTGDPDSGNSTWIAWRRAQINAFVKQMYCRALAAKPNIKVGASVWKTSASGRDGYLQDWDAWMLGHYIDYVCPMNYTSNNSTWTANNNDNLAHAHGRHVYAGQDTCGNTAANSAWQVDDYLNDAGPGVSMYSRACATDSNRAALVAGPFSSTAGVAPMSWKSSPTKGILMGDIENTSGTIIYGVQVSINGTGLSSTTDGTGFYGIVDVTPGTYSITVSKCGHITQVINNVVITAGLVTTQNVTLVPDGVPPVLSSIQATDIGPTSAVITWTTDEVATTQVQYGLTDAYGATTTENTLPVTSHSVELLNLTVSTTYHYRVISKDCANATATSGDFTFTTTAYPPPPADIIIDNDDPTHATWTGTWSTGASGTDKYGADYRYCAGGGTTKYFYWIPEIETACGYNVYAWWSAGSTRASNAAYLVIWNGGSQFVTVNQQVNGGTWNLLVANKTFAVGTTGYVRLSNSGVSSSQTVIADAVKFESTMDYEPPSVPANLHVTSLTTNRVDMAWNASTDNKGVAGYKVYRGEVMFTTVTTTSAYNGGLLANAVYPFSVRAYDTSSNESERCAPINTYTLPLAITPEYVTCDRSTNTWYNTSLFTFTSTEGWGVGVRAYFRVLWDTNPTYTFTGGEDHWSADTYGASCEDPGVYYIHLQSCNGDGVTNGTYDFGPFKYDNTPPEVTVTDDGLYTDAAGQLHASWSGSDPTSGADEYQYAIGTTSGGLDVRGWTSVGTDTSVTTTGLTLSAGTDYYFSVKAHNGAGLWSDPENSDGIRAANVVATIHDAKVLPNDTPVILNGKLMGAGFGAYGYIQEEDRSSGIRANATMPAGPASLSVAGTLAVVNGERVLDNAEVKDEEAGGWPDAIFMVNREIGGGDLNAYTPGITGAVSAYNLGLLITTTGKVTYAGTGYCYIDDGSALSDGSGYFGVKVDTTEFTTPPAFEEYVKITGISALELSGENSIRLIRPRGDGDLWP